MNPSTSSAVPLLFKPGAPDTAISTGGGQLVLECPMPWLAGPPNQVLATGNSLRQRDGGATIETATTVAGVLAGSGHGDLESETRDLYRRLFEWTRGLHLHRVWNFVPDINRHEHGIENYLAFNAGRHSAFAAHFGEVQPSLLPAASALGTCGGLPALAFTAGLDPVTHVENPLQIPARLYPERYGKIPPLFARGSVVRGTRGVTRHLSGTSSIRASETRGLGFSDQLAITMENIAVMLDKMDVAPGDPACWKVFLRDRRDLPECLDAMAIHHPGSTGHTLFLEADICRRDLLLEIEAIFHPAPHPEPAIV